VEAGLKSNTVNVEIQNPAKKSRPAGFFGKAAVENSTWRRIARLWQGMRTGASRDRQDRGHFDEA
jgi:hypothetical protein